MNTGSLAVPRGWDSVHTYIRRDLRIISAAGRESPLYWSAMHHSRRRGYCAVTQLLMSRRDADRRGLWTVDRAASGSRRRPPGASARPGRRPRGGECARALLEAGARLVPDEMGTPVPTL